ncbi:hypothetical protein B0H16DRAFT_1455292 [Mycena metata]|uniref:Uncharacterized protein n=1 Tax=Mycena metata TaxID=1033252 RepID=A0AAD7JHF0_9AGAR|nr:hypothetical protein B0H16DRAFT_1455292 [Mycena metata]
MFAGRHGECGMDKEQPTGLIFYSLSRAASVKAVREGKTAPCMKLFIAVRKKVVCAAHVKNRVSKDDSHPVYTRCASGDQDGGLRGPNPPNQCIVISQWYQSSHGAY